MPRRRRRQQNHPPPRRIRRPPQTNWFMFLENYAFITIRELLFRLMGNVTPKCNRVGCDDFDREMH